MTDTQNNCAQLLTDILAPNDLLRLMKIIRDSHRVVITAHHGPDGDAVGSCLAWQDYLQRMGKDVHVVLPNDFPDFLKWMPMNKGIVLYNESTQQALQYIERADLICCLDFNDFSRLQQMGDAVRKSKARRLMIDHHENPTQEGFDLVISHPEMSATAEIVFRLLWQMGAYDSMSRSAAANIYTGMMCDTGAFTYNSNDPAIYIIISLLMRKKIDKDEINKKVYRSWSQHKFEMWNDILNHHTEILPQFHAAYYTLTRQQMKDYRFIRGDAEGLVNEPLKIRGMRLSVALREDTEEDVIRVSLRSANGFHCREMAERFFNGGGHDDAAGGKLPFPMQSAVATLNEALEAFKEELTGKAE